MGGQCTNCGLVHDDNMARLQHPISSTCEYCGLLQLTGTRMVLELDPEEVEDVLRVTAMALVLPSLPLELWSSSNRRPITGVCQGHVETGRQEKNINITNMNIKWGQITWEISKVKSSVFPGRALDEPSHTRLTSRLDRSP